MKPNDFRCGIWIKDQSGNNILIDEDFLEILIGSRNYDHFFPIPLIHEILERAGFVKFRDSSYFYFKQVQIGLKEIEISVNPENGIIFYDAENQVKLPIRYTYLHQLQNLYFALTGEELNVEL